MVKLEVISRKDRLKNIKKPKQVFGDLNHVHHIYTSTSTWNVMGTNKIISNWKKTS